MERFAEKKLIEHHPLELAMGAIAAIVDKRGENAVPTVATMLKTLTHRGADACGVATQSSVEITRSLEEFEDIDLKSSVAIGYNFSRVTGHDKPQPILKNNCSLVFDGRFFPPFERTDIEEAASRLEACLDKNAKAILKELNGSYAFAVSQANKIIAGRDMFGTIPLYYGENENICGLASERKALWTLGMRDAKSFPPGNIAVVSPQGFAFEKVATIIQPRTRSIGMEAAARHLSRLLLEATVERIKDVEKVAVAFSGGLDSGVVAALAKMSNIEVHLISVGLENQQEVQHAERASKALGLPIHVRTYGVSDVEKVVSKVLWLIEESDPMKAGVAIPFFWTAKTAFKTGCRVLLAGQGGDELFGGYRRYLVELDQKGPEALQKILYRDVVSSYKTNFQRDQQVCAFHKVDLRLPFIDRQVVNFALSLPLKLKIESSEDQLRKRVLRRAAQNLGIPSSIANRTKKAVQYATGVNKALRTLAKSEGLTVGDYLKQLFYAKFPDLEAEP